MVSRFLLLTGATYAAGVAVGAATSSSGVITVGRGAASASNASAGLGVGGSVGGTAVGLGLSSFELGWRERRPCGWRSDRHRLRRWRRLHRR